MNTKPFTIGVFDSGIGGFSILKELVKTLPECKFIYYSDDANAPYGPKSDEFITERSVSITQDLLNQGASIIVVACNTATAASIETLRRQFSEVPFVGVEPYLNAYHKLNKNEVLNADKKIKMGVLTTVSTGKSVRFLKLVERIDPEHKIKQYSLVHLAKRVEELYYDKLSKEKFRELLKEELEEVKKEEFTHLILGCTHYPLVASAISEITGAETLGPCQHVALRVKDLLQNFNKELNNSQNQSNIFYFYSSSIQNWVEMKRDQFLEKFNQLK